MSSLKGTYMQSHEFYLHIYTYTKVYKQISLDCIYYIHSIFSLQFYNILFTIHYFTERHKCKWATSSFIICLMETYIFALAKNKQNE